MKNILVLGAGQSTPYLIRHLLDHAQDGGWSVLVADRDLGLARKRVGDHPRGQAVELDASDTRQLASGVQSADLVINLLAPVFQHPVAHLCVEHGRSMISASYQDRRVRDLHDAAVRRGALLLCEVGLDPGIDHMSAMALIDRVHSQGCAVTSFRSFCGGLPAPDSLSNPLKYAITWNPRNVVMAGQHGAQYLHNGKIRIVPHHGVFERTWPVTIDGIGAMQAYPNRDSLSYQETFGLRDAQTLIRGTLRYAGWCETWAQIVRLGLADESTPVPDLANRTYGELVEMLLPPAPTGVLEQRVSDYLGMDPECPAMSNLRWLGLFSDREVGAVDGGTLADALVALLSRRLALRSDQRDMVVLTHELEIAAGPDQPSQERLTSTLIEYGEPGGFTAMSKTVGLPAALAAELMLSGKLSMVGSRIPTDRAVYEPILARLHAAGLQFIEATEPIGL